MNLGDDLYREIILENYKSIRNKRRLDEADHHHEGVNPSCGDDIELFLKLDGNEVSEVTYEGVGCSICMASANMLCEALEGASLGEASQLLEKVKGMLTREEDPEFPDQAADIEALQGVRKFPVRVKCAMLAWNTLAQILKQIPETKKDAASKSPEK